MAESRLELRWSGAGLSFEAATPEGARVVVDGDAGAGASPMQMLLVAVAGCTAADIVDILGKMRVGLGGLTVEVSGERAAEAPRRYLSLRLRYTATGLAEGAGDKLRRAVALSHEKYCSALHSLAPDISLETEVVSA